MDFSSVIILIVAGLLAWIGFERSKRKDAESSLGSQATKVEDAKLETKQALNAEAIKEEQAKIDGTAKPEVKDLPPNEVEDYWNK